MMKLYSAPLSLFSAKVDIALREKGLPFEIELVPFNMRTRYAPKHKEVLRHNPKGQVPLLIDGDLVLYDSTLIFEYLEDIRPAPALWPSGPRARASARLRELVADEVFFPSMLDLQNYLRDPNAEPALAIKADVARHYDTLSENLAVSAYLGGVSFGYADIAWFMAHFFAVFLGADLEDRHGRVRAWRERIAARPTVATVVAPMADYLAAAGLKRPDFAPAQT